MMIKEDSTGDLAAETAGVSAVAEKSEVRKGSQSSSDRFKVLKAEGEALATPEEKLLFAVAKMEEALSQGGTPLFKLFWELRGWASELFKEVGSPLLRTEQWGRYQELSKEARRLKEIFDQKSSFAAEQIEIAIKAIEESLLAAEREGSGTLENQPRSLRNSGYYETMHQKLLQLNADASRINTLRKELIKTELRIAVKNKFFQRLSAAGDKVFPQRKELIQELSDRFIADVDLFLMQEFNSASFDKPLHFLRDEIKCFQGLAKELTLNTQAFTHSRKKLSDCWEKVRDAGKEQRKEQAGKRELHLENKQKLLEQLAAIEAQFKEGVLSVGAAEQRLDEFSKQLRTVELGPSESKELREAVNGVKKPLLEKKLADEELRRAAESKRHSEQKAEYKSLSDQIEALSQEAASLSVAELKRKKEQLASTIQEVLLITAQQKQELAKRLRPLEEQLLIKTEEELLCLSDDEKEKINNYREVLKQRRQRRKEIKEQLDQIRKEASGSGFDIEQSLRLHEQIVDEEKRLASADEAIDQMISLLNELKQKVLG